MSIPPSPDDNDLLSPHNIMEGELLLKQSIGEDSKSTFAVLLDCSDFIVYSAPTRDLEIYRFKSTICWVSSTRNVSNKGLFVVNDSHNCCMYFFEVVGSQSLLDEWLKAFVATGWKISTVVNKEPQFKLYHQHAHQYQQQQQQDNNGSNGSHDQSFDPSQLKYASLSLNSSVNFNSLQMTGDNNSVRSTRSLVDSQSSNKLLRRSKATESPDAYHNDQLVLTQHPMERSVSLPSLVQGTTVMTSLQTNSKQDITCEQIIKDNDTDEQQIDNSNVVVKLRNPKNITKSATTDDAENVNGSNSGGVRIRPQSNMYRRSNAAESGYCSKESLLMLNDVERPIGGVGGGLLLSSSSHGNTTANGIGVIGVGKPNNTNNSNDRNNQNTNKQLILAVPYSFNKDDPLVSYFFSLKIKIILFFVCFDWL